MFGGFEVLTYGCPLGTRFTFIVIGALIAVSL